MTVRLSEMKKSVQCLQAFPKNAQTDLVRVSHGSLHTHSRFGSLHRSRDTLPVAYPLPEPQFVLKSLTGNYPYANGVLTLSLCKFISQ